MAVRPAREVHSPCWFAVVACLPVRAENLLGRPPLLEHLAGAKARPETGAGFRRA